MLNRFGRRQDHRRGAIVEARGVAGGNGLAFTIDRLELGQAFGRSVGTRMLVTVDDDFALLGLDHHRDDFLGVVTGFLGRSCTLLAAQAKGVLVGAADAVVLGDIVTGDRHRVDAILLFHQRVDEAPAQGGVFQLLAAAKGAVGLAHHVRRAGHRLDASSDGQFHLARGDGAEGSADRFHARGAQTVQGHARHRLRQAGEQQRHAGDVAVVFAGLVGAAHKHFIDR